MEIEQHFRQETTNVSEITITVKIYMNLLQQIRDLKGIATVNSLNRNEMMAAYSFYYSFSIAGWVYFHSTQILISRLIYLQSRTVYMFKS